MARAAPLCDAAAVDPAPAGSAAPGRARATGDAAVRLTASAVAARLGVSPSTLRTWHRRHGLGPTGHTSGRHRRYTLEDLVRLERVRALIACGVSVQSAADLTAVAPARPPAPAPPPPGAGPAHAALRDLLRHAADLDGPAIRRLVTAQVQAVGVVAAWERLCVPALTALGSADPSRPTAVAAEHVVSWALGAVLKDPPAPPVVEPHRAVLLACAPGERHQLPLDALRAALAEAGTAVRTLGQDTPTAALTGAIAHLRPAVVVVWAQTPATARVTALPTGGPPPVTVALGPGWAGCALPAGSRTAAGLSDAVATIAGVLDGPTTVVAAGGPPVARAGTAI